MKKIISLIAAASAIISLTISVSAAGYARDPEYRPSTPAATAPVVVASDQLINSANGTGVVDLRYGGVISLDTLETILRTQSGHGRTLDFQSTMSGNQYSLSIPIDSITRPRLVDVSLQVGSVSRPQSLFGKATLPAGTAKVQPSITGSFGMDFIITLPKSQFSSARNEQNQAPVGVQLIYANERTSTVRVEQEFIEFNANGSVTFKINHASSYYLAPVYNNPGSEPEAVNLSKVTEPEPEFDPEPDENTIDDGEIELIVPTPTPDPEPEPKPQPDAWWENDGTKNPPTGVSMSVSAVALLAASGFAVVVTQNAKRRR